MFDLTLYKNTLSTNLIGQSIQYYPELNSTNTKAWELISKNSPNGTVVITDNQLKGRGRQANKWMSTPNKSLTYSIILYPKVQPNKMNLYSLIAGLAITDYLIEIDIQAKLKWPNDILINGKKASGILCESKISGSVIKSMVIGIGLNVNEKTTELPEELCDKATSLMLESGKQYQLEIILANILNHLENRIKNKETNSQLLDWEKRCAHLNQKVTFHSSGQKINGIFTRLTPKGQARINIDGKEIIFDSGEIVE